MQRAVGVQPRVGDFDRVFEPSSGHVHQVFDDRVGVPHRLPVVLQVLPESEARIVEDPEYAAALDFEVREFLVLDLPFDGVEHLVEIDPELVRLRVFEFGEVQVVGFASQLLPKAVVRRHRTTRIEADRERRAPAAFEEDGVQVERSEPVRPLGVAQVGGLFFEGERSQGEVEGVGSVPEHHLVGGAPDLADPVGEDLPPTRLQLTVDP